MLYYFDADYPGLRNAAAIEDLRRHILNAFRAYTTGLSVCLSLLRIIWLIWTVFHEIVVNVLKRCSCLVCITCYIRTLSMSHVPCDIIQMSHSCKCDIQICCREVEMTALSDNILNVALTSVWHLYIVTRPTMVAVLGKWNAVVWCSP